ncbi:hypothetical protein YC2023_035626 [Brassica napus]
MNPVYIMSRTFHLTRKQGAIEAGEPYTCNVKALQKRKNTLHHKSDTHREQEVFLWTSVVSGFVRNLRAKEAVAKFHEMLGLGLQPNNFTYFAILILCSSVQLVD